MKKVVISVGMGPQQLAFIKRLKKNGYTVVAFGKGKNSAEAIRLCDYSAELDTHDPEAAIRWIDSLGVQVAAVGSFAGGGAVQTVQRLSNYYGTVTAIPDELAVGSDKTKQQLLLEKYGLSTIHTWKISELTDGDIHPNEEYILKPVSGRGSEGITILSGETLMHRYRDNGDVCKEDIVQDVRKGDEYRCVTIVQNGKLKLLAPVLRRSYRDTVFLGVLRYADDHLDRLQAYIQRFLADSGIQNSIIKADIIVSEESIDMIEMDIGVGGGTYYKTFVSRLYDRNLMDEYIRLITGDKVTPFQVARPNLRMDYVFNHQSGPVEYDLEECRKALSTAFGECEIQVNQLHPEKKGGFSSNADFIMTVIRNHSSDEKEPFAVDDFVNKRLLRKAEKI